MDPNADLPPHVLVTLAEYVVRREVEEAAARCAHGGAVVVAILPEGAVPPAGCAWALVPWNPGAGVWVAAGALDGCDAEWLAMLHDFRGRSAETIAAERWVRVGERAGLELYVRALGAPGRRLWGVVLDGVAHEVVTVAG